jgi:ribosomal protein S18 acetylase RimI-like enzyme
MVELKFVTIHDWQTIQKIAYATWPNTFSNIMSKEQVKYMLALIYSEESLRNQMMDQGHKFILALKDNEPAGFASYELNYHGKLQLMIHKIYLLPESQGLGIGRKIFDHLTAIAKANNNTTLRLKVFHKNNKAAGFYLKYGFKIAGMETTDIGNGYIVLDKIMIKEI